MRDWKSAASVLKDFVIPQFPLIHETASSVFVEATVEVHRCRSCGDAVLPCDACKVRCCSNGLCSESKHAGCPALEG